MPTPKKKKSGKEQVGALDSKQRELQEQQSRVQAEIEALQRTIADAPARAAAQRQRSQEAMLAAAPRQYTLGASTLDTRHVEAAAAAGRTRPGKGRRKPAVLRAEKKAAWVQTVALVIGLAFAICWAISHFYPL